VLQANFLIVVHHKITADNKNPKKNAHDHGCSHFHVVIPHQKICKQEGKKTHEQRKKKAHLGHHFLFAR